MITLQSKLPRKLHVACSGGVDSVAALHFLSRKHDVTALHINHNEGNSDAAETIVRNLCDKLHCKLVVKRITSVKPAICSLEEFWRNERYELFHSTSGAVVTAHTLEDCIETWVWSSLHGSSKLIPQYNRNVVRPFRMTAKKDFISWARTNKLTWVEDTSNSDLTLSRNYIRQVMMPNILFINPGISKTIKKKVRQDNAPRVCINYDTLPL